jgi:dolichyl-phosphate-mannose--protein O-mannosyl transferase
LAAWLVLYVPWVLVLRNQIFFYYLTPLVPFMALGLVWCLREATRRSRFGRPLTVMVTVAVVVCAVVFLPLWIGLWVSPEHLERLLLFDGWHFR